jgi:M6 family metalloprotease-like protein
MKKSMFLLAPIALIVSACDMITFPSISIPDSSLTPSTSTETTSTVGSSASSSVTSNSQVSSTTSLTNNEAPFIPTSLQYVQDLADFWSIPSVGNPKVLVVPVEFPDSIYANPTAVKNNINTAFNGAGNSSFQSLNSFYKQSSFDKLDLEGVVLDPFRTQFNSSYYENLTSADPNTVVINEIMTYYNNTIDFTEFDYNNDGYLDGIYMIYNHPAGEWASFWWAYLYTYFGNSSFDGVRPTSYIWMPYEFVYYNNAVDSITFIHETGHMLGLEDYYDYAPNDGSGNEHGLGGADMMDSNAGDHNPWSKMILGWIDPLVVDRSMVTTLLPYISSGQALIITDQWNGTLFDEFIVAMYYTPTGFYSGLNDFFFDGQPGMVLYHVDARLGVNNSQNYPTMTINNNTDTPNKLIKYIEADGNNSLYNASPSGWMWQGDVYRPGNIFRGNKNVNYTWHQSSLGAIDFTIEFVSEASNYGGITLHIDYAS